MGTAAAIGGMSLVGSYLGADAAGDAAQTSADASRYAADLTDKQYWQTREDLAPYRDVATGEGGALTKLADYGRSQVLEGDYIPASAVPQYDPNFDLTKDPSYQWRQQEQERMINRNMAGMGKVVSGNRLEEIMSRSGQMASQEYAAADARNRADYGITRANEAVTYGRGVDAYGRAIGQEGDYLNRLASLANIGQTATASTGAFGQAAAANQGANIVAAGQAQAAGQIGQASAWQQGIGDLTSLGTQYMLSNQTPYASDWVSNDPSVWG